MKARAEQIDGYVILVTPYSRSFLDSLKAAVPSFARTYDPATKTWQIDDLYGNEAIALAGVWFELTVVDMRKPKTAPSTGAGWAALLFAAIPERLREPVFRALIKVLHPDRDGDTAAMQQLTAAYDRSRGVR